MTKFFVLIICFLSATATFAQTEVIYHIHQRSFFDSDANGNGDLEGVRQKLDYLQTLGITTIQLSPIYQADMKKSTNDTNFEKVAIEYGKFINYRNLVQDLHRRKMKLYLEIEPGYLQTIAAQDKNPKIRESLTKALKYWADPNTDGKFYDGADGFVVLAMADTPMAANKTQNLLKDFWAPIIAEVKKVNPALQIIAEPDNKNTAGNHYFSKAGVDVVIASKLQRAVRAFSKKDIVAAADSTFNYLPTGKQAIVFLEDASAKRFATQVAGDLKKLKVGAALNLLIGSIPSIYYGQELGMKGSAELPEAFEWDAADAGTGMAVWYKDSPLYDGRTAKANDGLSLEEEQKDANSLFSYYRLLFKLKATENALSGTYNNLSNDNDNVFSFTRTSDKGTILVVINLSAVTEQVMLENDGKLRVDQVKLLSGAADVKFARGGRSLALPPYAIQVWKVLN